MSYKKQNNAQDLLIYGKHPVISALNNPNRKFKNLYTTKEIWQEIGSSFSEIEVKVHLMESYEIDMRLPDGVNHQNIVLEVFPLKTLEIEDIIAETASKESSCLVILDQITDPHNIGAIIRSAAAFSADAIILTEHNSPSENQTIIKSAAGACESIPLVKVTNLASCMKTLQEEGYWIIGLDGHTEIELNHSIFSNKIVLVLGSEDKGMRKLTKKNCDYIAKIKISKNMESLNVSNAAAIALYEFSRYTS
jgi:23S rRNA (guanosine2251-2'-O)-methyltransferase